MTIVSAIIGILIGAIFSGLIIWIIGKLGWGLEVDGFGPAYIAAIIIAVLNGLASWIWGLLGFSALSTPTHILLTAGFLMVVGERLNGLRVKGFAGALIAALIIAGIGWLITYGVGLLV